MHEDPQAAGGHMGQAVLATAYIAVLGAYAINDFTTPLGAPFWRLFYAMTIGAVLLTTALRIAESGRVRMPAGIAPLFLIVVFIAVSGLVMALFQKHPNTLYLLGDFATLVMLAMTIFLVAQLPSIYLQGRYLRILVVLLLVAAVVGVTIGGRFQGERFAGRFDPPHVLLFAATLAAIPATRQVMVKLLLAAAAGVLIYLAVQSGQRTAPIVFVLLVLAAILSSLGGARAFLAACVVTLALATSVVFFGDRIAEAVRTALIESAAQYRYEELVESGGDQSIQGRIFEASDVIEITRNADAGTLLFGHGHGATYEPHLSFPEPNVTELGRVHNIHIGPFLLLYRYGLIGVGFYLWLGYILLFDFVRMHTYQRVLRDADLADALFVYTTFYLAMAGAFVNFHMRTVLNDPIWAFVIAGYFGYRGSGISPVAVLRNRVALRPRRDSTASAT